MTAYPIVSTKLETTVISTSFGVVKVGKNARSWVDEPKRKKDKKERLRQLERAVEVMAHLKWHKGGVLERIE